MASNLKLRGLSVNNLKRWFFYGVLSPSYLLYIGDYTNERAGIFFKYLSLLFTKHSVRTARLSEVSQ